MIKNVLLLVVLLSMTSVSNISAQSEPKLRYEKLGRTDKLKEPPVEESEEKTDLIFKSNQQFEKTIKQPKLSNQPVACEAEIALDYSQEDTQLRVNTVIDVSGCDATAEENLIAAAHGAYRILVKTKQIGEIDKPDNINTQAFRQEWQIENADSIELTNYYSLPENSEVLKAKIQLRQREACWCGEAEVE